MEESQREKEYFSMCKCKICGKNVYKLSFINYAWKIKNNIFCSYSCMRKYEKKENKKKYKNIVKDN